MGKSMVEYRRATSVRIYPTIKTAKGVIAMSSNTSHFSLVLETPAAGPEEAHFLAKLSVETDAADVRLDLQRGQNGFLLIDARGAEDFEECHIPGAINLPYRHITAEYTAYLSKEQPIVVYCWSPGCNSATKAAAKLSG